MTRASRFLRFLYRLRDLRSRPLFEALDRYCRGDVLDVGGGDFFQSAARRGVRFASWTVLEPAAGRAAAVADPRVRVVEGDGCAMTFADESYDTVLNVQVLEHVFEPIRMVQEIGRVLRAGGHAIFLIPQTSSTHLAPDYHGNFSRYWIAEAMARAGLVIVEQRPLGGLWSSMASHLFFFFLQSLRYDGMSDPAIRRGPAFYALYPLMLVFAALALPICLFLALGDLREEPNNHLVVARKPAR